MDGDLLKITEHICPVADGDMAMCSLVECKSWVVKNSVVMGTRVEYSQCEQISWPVDEYTYCVPWMMCEIRRLRGDEP